MIKPISNPPYNQTLRIEKPPVKLRTLANCLGVAIKVKDSKL